MYASVLVYVLKGFLYRGCVNKCNILILSFLSVFLKIG